MADYTNEQIKTAADGIIAGGGTWADVYNTAQKQGVTLDQLAGSYGMTADAGATFLRNNGVTLDGYPAPAPAPAPTPAPAPAAPTSSTGMIGPTSLSDAEIASARSLIDQQYGGYFDPTGQSQSGSLFSGGAYDPNANLSGGNYGLTPDERNMGVLGMLINKGYSVDAAQQITGLSKDTITNYIQNLYQSTDPAQANYTYANDGATTVSRLDDAASLFRVNGANGMYGDDASQYSSDPGVTQYDLAGLGYVPQQAVDDFAAGTQAGWHDPQTDTRVPIVDAGGHVTGYRIAYNPYAQMPSYLQGGPAPTAVEINAWRAAHPGATYEETIAAMRRGEIGGAGNPGTTTGTTTGGTSGGTTGGTTTGSGGMIGPSPTAPSSPPHQGGTGGGSSGGASGGSASTAYGSTSPVANGGFQPDLDHQVTPEQTIEGRLSNLMATDAKGNYTNPQVRQAVDRSNQQFAARGLLNSSMAVQAGQEAAIAKAIEIAGPDAQKFFDQSRANQDARNVFARDQQQQSYTERNNLAQWAQDRAMQADRLAHDTAMQNSSQAHDLAMAQSDQQFRTQFLTQEQTATLRNNYLTAQDNASERYNRTVAQINASNMTPEDKSVAIAQAGAVRDGDLAYNNNLFAAQPGFASEWLALAVPTSGVDVSTISNVDTLSNIANDPAQPQATREAAKARIAQLQAAAPAPAPASDTAAVPADDNQPHF